MKDWLEERQYCNDLSFLQEADNPDKYVLTLVSPPGKEPWTTERIEDVFVIFYPDHWEFWTGDRKVYFSTEDNLSYVLENMSAFGTMCPICGCDINETEEGCCVWYYKEGNITLFWACSRDPRHRLAVYGNWLERETW